MSLPRDISRCLGVRHSGPIVVTCHERNNCRRYLAAASGDFGPRTPNSPHLCTTPQREMQINSERQS